MPARQPVARRCAGPSWTICGGEPRTANDTTTPPDLKEFRRELRALIRHIERYIEQWNVHPTPFVWTKNPADIIKKPSGVVVNMTFLTEH